MLLPSLGSQYPDMLYDVECAEDFNLGKVTDFDCVGVKALNSKLLEVRSSSIRQYNLFFAICVASEIGSYPFISIKQSWAGNCGIPSGKQVRILRCHQVARI